MGKHGIVCGKGINDLPRGWIVESDYNKRVYKVWKSMICRCYSKKWHEKHPTYKDCYVCDRWLRLSNFVNDVVKIDNYEYWLNHPNERVALDKDIKVQGNKEYSFENCMFVSIKENARQATKTRDNEYLQGKNNPMYGRTGEKAPLYGKHHSEETRAKQSEAHKGKPKGQLIDRYTLDGTLIDTKYHFQYVQMGFNKGNISSCCKGRIKTYKGYIFKYHNLVLNK